MGGTWPPNPTNPTQVFFFFLNFLNKKFNNNYFILFFIVYFHPLSNLTNHDKNARNKTKSDPNMLNDDFSISKHARNCLIDVV